MFKKLIITVAALALLATACGGDDGSATTLAGGTTSAGGETPTTASASGDLSCQTLVSVDEAAALFGEPATFDAAGSQDVGGSDARICSFSSLEDEADLEDLTSHLLLVQVYRGAEFYAPDLVAPDAEHIDGIGDDAYVSGNLDTAFIDGDLVGFVSYTVIDLSGGGADPSAKRDQVIELLRLVHDRLT